jgi:hypothetical protein
MWAIAKRALPSVTKIKNFLMMWCWFMGYFICNEIHLKTVAKKDWTLKMMAVVDVTDPFFCETFVVTFTFTDPGELVVTITGG